MANPLVTVYIPTRNRLPMVRNALNSCIYQSIRDIEIIVVDDSSSDGTAAYLEAMTNNDPRIRYIRNNKPLGAPAARNIAIELASGFYLTGLDDDDIFFPSRLERLVMMHRQMSPSCVTSQDFIVTEKSWRVTKKPDVVSIKDLKYYNCLGNQVLAPTDVFRQAGGFDPNLIAAQDYDLWLRIVHSFGPARVLPEALQIICMSDHYDRISNSEKRQMGLIKFMQKYMSFSSPDVHLIQEFLMLPCNDETRAARVLSAAVTTGAPYHVWRELTLKLLGTIRRELNSRLRRNSQSA